MVILGTTYVFAQSQNEEDIVCFACIDSNCIHCEENNAICTECEPGFTLVDGVC